MIYSFRSACVTRLFSSHVKLIRLVSLLSLQVLEVFLAEVSIHLGTGFRDFPSTQCLARC